MKVLVEVSARYIHLNRESLEILWGKDYELCPVKKLSQPNSYASQVRLELIFPKKSINNVAILGQPLRKENQIEISLTDARSLRINWIICETGHLEGSSPIKIKGPNDILELN